MRHRVARGAAVALAGIPLAFAAPAPAPGQGSDSKPVLLLGRPPATRATVLQVLQPENVRYETPADWVPPAAYSRYALVWIDERLPGSRLWSASAEYAAVESYVRGGGVVVLTGSVFRELGEGFDMQALEPLLGFRRWWYGEFDAPPRFRITAAGKDYFPAPPPGGFDWSPTGIRILDLTHAQVLIEQTDPAGGRGLPYATVQPLGRGRVYWFSKPLMRMNYPKRGEEGEPVEEGRFVRTRLGESLDVYRQALRQIVRAAAPARGNLVTEKWVPEPLGEPAAPRTSAPLQAEIPAKRAETVAIPAGSEVVLARDGQAVLPVLVPDSATANELDCARIIKAHLDLITGGDQVIARTPETEPGRAGDGAVTVAPNGIVLATADSPAAARQGLDSERLPPEGLLLRTGNGGVLVAGADAAGLRHATYAFLEELGCRYLWPGDLGKIIPRRPTLTLKPLVRREQPPLAFRHIRSDWRARPEGCRRLGVDPNEYNRRFREASRSSTPDQGWFAWHGLGRREELAYGHSFGDYWKRFGAVSPEWFALQPNGVRDQSLSPTRPRLCHSNPHLIQQAVDDRLAKLRAAPDAWGVRVGLNDGGRTTFCLCKKCRRLDPVNGRAITLTDQTLVPRRDFPYVSLTDRVVWFSNQIAAGVVREFPDAFLGFYAYSAYSAPPRREKPHPNLFIVQVSNSIEDWHAWTRCGNRMGWRPQILDWNRETIVPQAFGERVVRHLQVRAASGLLAVDLDGLRNHWALMGLTYYVTAKAVWAPDRADYGRLRQDYCRAGFGPAAADIEEYFEIIAALSAEAYGGGVPLVSLYDRETLTRLGSCLERARQAAAAAPDAAYGERIGFLGLGLEWARLRSRLHETPDNSAVHEEIKRFLIQVGKEYPLAVNASRVAASLAL